MFVWVFHRISGLVLIFLLSFQLLTGFSQARLAKLSVTDSSDHAVLDLLAGLHQHTVLIGLTVFLLIFHALYGVRTILMDLGLGREKPLFWCCNVVGLVVFVVFLVLYTTLVLP